MTNCQSLALQHQRATEVTRRYHPEPSLYCVRVCECVCETSISLQTCRPKLDFSAVNRQTVRANTRTKLITLLLCEKQRDTRERTAERLIGMINLMIISVIKQFIFWSVKCQQKKQKGRKKQVWFIDLSKSKGYTKLWTSKYDDRNKNEKKRKILRLRTKMFRRKTWNNVSFQGQRMTRITTTRVRPILHF